MQVFLEDSGRQSADKSVDTFMAEFCYKEEAAAGKRKAFKRNDLKMRERENCGSMCVYKAH